MIKKTVYLLIVLCISSCIFSGEPDCDDVSIMRLQTKLISFMKQTVDADIESKRDSIKAKFNEVRFNYMSIFPPENSTLKYDSLKNSFHLAMDRLDLLEQQRQDSITPILESIIVKRTGKVITRSENIALTTFHCTCKAKYMLNEYHGNFIYKLTRHGFDRHTYLQVTNASSPK